MLRLVPVITTLALALSGCAGKEAGPPAPKTYSKPTNAEICDRIDFGLLFSTVLVGVGIYDDAASAIRVHEGDVKRYAPEPKQLPALSASVERAVLTSNRPGDDWFYLADAICAP